MGCPLSDQPIVLSPHLKSGIQPDDACRNRVSVPGLGRDLIGGSFSFRFFAGIGIFSGFGIFVCFRGICLFLKDRLDGERDPLLLVVDLSDLYCHRLPGGEDVRHLIDSVYGEL